MSLAPGERRVLAGIERELRRSDPRLAAMLERFEWSSWRAVRHQLGWPLRRLPKTLVISLLVTFSLGLVLFGVLGHSTGGAPGGVSCGQPAAGAWTAEVCPASVAGRPPGHCPVAPGHRADCPG